jgi:hypothetical protein
MYLFRIVSIASSSSSLAASRSHVTGACSPDRDIPSLPARPVFFSRTAFHWIRSRACSDRKHRADSQRPLVISGDERASHPCQHRLRAEETNRGWQKNTPM